MSKRWSRDTKFNDVFTTPTTSHGNVEWNFYECVTKSTFFTVTLVICCEPIKPRRILSMGYAHKKQETTHFRLEKLKETDGMGNVGKNQMLM
jgi:hypothetical protein